MSLKKNKLEIFTLTRLDEEVFEVKIKRIAEKRTLIDYFENSSRYRNVTGNEREAIRRLERESRGKRNEETETLAHECETAG